MDTLVSLAGRFPLPGLVRDLHPLDDTHAGQTKKSLKQSLAQGSRENGGDLLSHGCAVPSARLCLTSLFGMGRGGTTVL